MTAYVLRDGSEFEVHLVPAQTNDTREAMIVQLPNGWQMSLWSSGKFQIQSGNSLMSPGVDLTEHDVVSTHNNTKPKDTSPRRRKVAAK